MTEHHGHDQVVAPPLLTPVGPRDPGKPPRLVGRTWVDVTPELQKFLEKSSDHAAAANLLLKTLLVATGGGTTIIQPTPMTEADIFLHMGA